MRALVGRFQGLVFGVCFRMLNHRQDAEDVTQEVFLRVFRSLGSWNPERPFQPWLLTIAVNRCRTALGRRSRRPIPVEMVVEPESTSTIADGGDVAEEVQLALEDLREEYRTCFVLFHNQQLSLEDIAAIMDRPTGTVKTWLHRARRQLADDLRRRGFERGDSE